MIATIEKEIVGLPSNISYYHDIFNYNDNEVYTITTEVATEVVWNQNN